MRFQDDDRLQQLRTPQSPSIQWTTAHLRSPFECVRYSCALASNPAIALLGFALFAVVLALHLQSASVLDESGDRSASQGSTGVFPSICLPRMAAAGLGRQPPGRTSLGGIRHLTLYRSRSNVMFPATIMSIRVGHAEHHRMHTGVRLTCSFNSCIMYHVFKQLKGPSGPSAGRFQRSAPESCEEGDSAHSSH